MAEVDGDFARTWVEFADPDHAQQVYRCDLTWLTSAYRCIFGQGCAGIYQHSPASGCCTLGAHFSGDEDLDRVRTQVARLTPEVWQHHPGGVVHDSDWTEPDSDGEVKTRTATTVGQQACVLHNAPGFAGGYGCALHLLALNEDESVTDTKPDVCWQLPLRRAYRTVTRPDETTYLEVTIGEYDRRGWGPGGHDLDWYCTGNDEAHLSPEPVYLTHAEELIALMSEGAYAALVAHCEVHLRGGRRLLTLHPASPPPLS